MELDEEASWNFRWGEIPSGAGRGTRFIAQSLGAKLMEPGERTGMPPFCAIDGVFTFVMSMLTLS